LRSLLYYRCLVLTACPPSVPADPCEANPDLPECQPLPCEPDCIAAKVVYTTTLKPAPATYIQGEAMNRQLSISLEDPDKTIFRGTVF
jgi:hypothetical protein